MPKVYLRRDCEENSLSGKGGIKPIGITLG